MSVFRARVPSAALPPNLPRLGETWCLHGKALLLLPVSHLAQPPPRKHSLRRRLRGWLVPLPGGLCGRGRAAVRHQVPGLWRLPHPPHWRPQADPHRLSHPAIPGNLSKHSLKFLKFNFQAIECYLANISPKDDENVSAFVLEELIANQIVQARMIGTNEAGVPMIHLYRATNGQTTMVNKELVDRSCANWIETTIVQLDPSEVATS